MKGFINLTYFDSLFEESILNLGTSVFKSGEVAVQVHWPKRLDPIAFYIVAHPLDSESVMSIFMLTDAVRARFPAVPIHLQMVYLPYDRHDREFPECQGIGIRMFANLVNAQKYASVQIEDPHSNVSPALFNNVLVHNICDIVTGKESHPCFENADAIVIPDAGAKNRASAVANILGVPTIQLNKVRSGNSITTKLDRALPKQFIDKTLTVVDDICDGGRTFVAVAEALRAAGFKGKLNLWVTHGLFTYGKDLLKEYFDIVGAHSDYSPFFKN